MIKKSITLLIALLCGIVVFANTTVYLAPGVWETDGAKYAVYYYGGSTEPNFTNYMTAIGDYYKTEVPDDCTSVIFLRLNPFGGIDWNSEWNREEVAREEGKNLYTVTSWSMGEWSVYDDDNTKITLTMSDYAATSFMANGVTISTAKAGGLNNPAYNSTNKDLRVYANGTLTISAEKEIIGLSFGLSSQGQVRLASLTSNVGQMTVSGSPDYLVQWEGYSNEIVITVGAKADYGSDKSKAGQLCFLTLEVTFASDVSHPREYMGEVSIHDFIEGNDNRNIYQLTGIVHDKSSDDNSGRFTLVDETGSIYVNGLLTADSVANAFESLDVGVGDTLTIRAVKMVLNGEPRINNAVFVSRKVKTGYFKPLGDYFLVGGFTNGWDLQQAVEFVDVNGVLTANVSKFNGAFKITKGRSWDANWGNTNNQTIQLGERYPLTYFGENIQLDNPLITCYRNAVFTLEQNRAGNYFLTLVGGQLEPLEADWYLPSEQVAWECTEATKMTPMPGNANQFFIRFEELSGKFKLSRGNWAVEFGVSGNSNVKLNTLYSLSSENTTVPKVSGTLHDVVVLVTIDYEHSIVEMEILQEAQVYTVPATLFPTWEEGDSVLVKLTTASGEYSRTGMEKGQNGVYTARIILPDQDVTSLSFVQLDDQAAVKAEKEALQGAVTDNGEWTNRLFATIGETGYWIPLPSRQISITENSVVYFDNSVTQWENAYLRVGRCQSHGYGSDWSRTWPMQHIDNTDIWYAQVDVAIAGEETWMITDQQGNSGEGQSVFALPEGCNIIMPTTNSIDNSIWIIARSNQTPQEYILWNYWTSKNRSAISPSYSLTNVPDTLYEGENIRIGVQSSIPYNNTRRFQLKTNPSDSRVSATPSHLDMPAMSTYGEFEVSIANDTDPLKDHAVRFRLQESNLGTVYTSDTVWIIDDDIPQISLSLSVNSIAEDAGMRSLTATIRRHTLLDRSVTVRLSDNASGNIYYHENPIVFQNGETERSVSLGIIDNTQAYGNTAVTVSAAVYMPSCNCTAEESTAGYASQTLLILDNDEPALSLSINHNMLLEGKENVARLTVSRNTPVDTDLTVNVTVDHPEGIVMPSTITILAGSSSASCDISVQRNGEPDDSHSVVFSASCEGFSGAVCYAMVVDQTLPDAIVEILYEGSSTSLEVNQEVPVSIRVVNQGAAGLAKGVRVELLSTVGMATQNFALENTLPEGDTLLIPATVTLPNRVGNCGYYAVVNSDRQVKELNHNNNTSSTLRFTVLPPFSVTGMQVDKQSYMPGDSVHVSGHAEGSLAANATIEIYVVNKGWRTSFRVTSDANGDFRGAFAPQAGQSGHFAIGACFPSENSSTEMTAAEFFGIEAPRTPATCQIISGHTYNGSIRVKNTGSLPLHNVRVRLDNQPENCEIQFASLPTLNASSSANLDFSLLSNTPTVGNEWEKINISITTDETLEVPNAVYYYCQNPKGQLQCSVNEIRTNIAAREVSNIIFYLNNTGLGETGEITLALPDWMQSLTSLQIPSIPSGEYSQVVLQTVPNEMFERNLNAPIEGQIGINPTNCKGMSLPFRLTPVSNNIGTLHVDVCDENTYYTVEKPHLQNAQVLIKNVSTGAVIEQGVTNENGIYEINLPEGYYGIRVSANDHDSYSNNVFVQPSGTTNLTVNLSIRAIEIDWQVVETEVEDEYEIITTVKYETQVPKPVVVVDAPSRIDADLLQEGESMMYTVKVTNQGLIRAEDVTVTLPSGGSSYTFEALAYGEPFNLEAKQSVEIPVKVTRIEQPNNAPARKKQIHNIIECQDNMLTLYYWDCGTDRKWHQYGVPLIYAKCDGDPTPTRPTDETGGGYVERLIEIFCPQCYSLPGTGGGGGGGGGYYGPGDREETPIVTKDEGCEPCQNQFIMKVINCGLSFTPAGGYLDMLKMLVGCYNAARKDYDVNNDLISAVVACAESQWEPLVTMFNDNAEERLVDQLEEITGVEGLSEMREGLGVLRNIRQCISELTAPCNLTAENAANAPARIRANAENYDYSDEPEYLARFKSRTKIIYDGLSEYEKYMNLYIDPEMLDYISNAEYVDLLRVWSIALTGDLETETLNNYRPAALPDNMWEHFVERMSNTYRYIHGDNTVTENYINPDEAVSCLQKMNECEQQAAEYGYASAAEMLEHEYALLTERLENKSENVCSTISLQLDQKMTMTRQAFRGTLSVFNGHETTAMTDIHLTLDIYDANGVKATDNKFQVSLESLDGMSGAAELESENGWTIAAKETGVATILFIPTKFAAPTESMVYSFGGQLSYTDPFTRLTVTRDLYPVQLTVNPSPQLQLTYFMQRDVFSDDPLTDEVEPAMPTEFALLINNIGYGDAENVRLTTKEPKIVDNEKGLLIDFHMLYALHNGNAKALPLNENIATDFGTIAAQEQSYAQWFFESSLLGHFVEYDVAYTHLTSYGNPDLSLIDNVSIHEMIHSIDMPATNPAHVGWLVNDALDANHLPDALYKSDGSILDLHASSDMALEVVNDSVGIITCTPSANGWNYGVVEAPDFDGQFIKTVTRLSDEAAMSLRNVWQTPCILRDGADPIHINRIHVADEMTATTSYRILFSERSVSQDSIVINDGETPELGDLGVGTNSYIVIEPGGGLIAQESNEWSGSITLVTNGSESGQIYSANDLGEAWDIVMEYVLNPSGATASPNLWYAFAVPFEVSATNGISRACDDKTLVVGQDYMILEFNGQERANSGNGWQPKMSGSLYPGRFYMLGIDGNCNRWLFSKKEGAEVLNSTAITNYQAASGNGVRNGWNGLGNTLLEYSRMDFGELDIFYLYTYNSLAGKYNLLLVENKNLCVGQPFFIQTGIDGVCTFSNSRANHMPALYAGKTEKPRIRFTLSDERKKTEDYMYLTFHDDAVASYTIGRDVVRMSTDCRTVAQLWCLADDGTQLSAHGIAYPTTGTTVKLGMFAPNKGEYLLDISTSVTDDYTIELLYQGTHVAMLFGGQPVEIDLKAGNNNDYSLSIQRKMPTDLPVTGDNDSQNDWYDILGRKAQQGEQGVFIRRGEKVVK